MLESPRTRPQERKKDIYSQEGQPARRNKSKRGTVEERKENGSGPKHRLKKITATNKKYPLMSFYTIE